MENKNQPVIALDAGGVIFVHSRDVSSKEDTSNVTNWMEKSGDVIQRLLDQGRNVVVNSFAGRATGEATTIAIQNVFNIPVYIVSNRDRKWEVLASLGQPSIMIDDTPDVLLTIRKEWTKALEREAKNQKPKKGERIKPLVGNLPCPRLILFGSVHEELESVQDWIELEKVLTQ